MRSTRSVLTWFSFGMLLAAVAFTLLELIAYSRQRENIPIGVTIGDVYVGGSTQEEASQLLLQVYNSPVEVHYQQEIFYVSPAQAGFALDLPSMLAAADSHGRSMPYWESFWDYLWQHPSTSYTVPLKASVSDSQIQSILDDIAARYDLPPTPPKPIPGTTNFSATIPGRTLNRDTSAELLKAALFSMKSRSVRLPISTTGGATPSIGDLELLIKQVPLMQNFEGLMDAYMINLQTGQDLHVVQYLNQDISKEPDVAFSAMSIMKITIMLATYRDLDGPPDAQVENWLRQMITISGNDPSDWLMERLDKNLGPLIVTDMLMKDLLLKNTFLAGYYHANAPLLQRFVTPANSRKDINTLPDSYNQTTPTDMGLLLEDIYQCAQGGGTLLVVYPGKVTPEECSLMIDWLAQDVENSLIKGGVPDGTRVAHKHGWIPDTIGDAAIVYSPGGNYVLTVFFWRPNGILWEQTSLIMAKVSQAVYNYFNPPSS